MNKLIKFFKDEDGLETVEYAIMLAFVAVGLFVAIVLLSGAVQNKFNNATDIIENGTG